jgi:hypothetical protein
VELDDVEPVVEVAPEGAALDLGLEVPIGGRDEPDVDRHRLRRPDRNDLPLLDGPEQLHLVAGVISPISSMKNVPPSAATSRPSLSFTAPVNEPFTWPNSSLSSRLSGSAPQLMERKAAVRAVRRAWMYAPGPPYPSRSRPR